MLSDDSEVEDIHTLTINEHYAKAFEHRKEREELSKLKEKYGSDVDENDVGDEEEDSEEAESEDEDGEELTPAVDAAILRTLARIKRKDPSIYESGKDVFEEEKQRMGEAKLSTLHAPKDKSKPLTIRQHALAAALEDASRSRSSSPEPLTHVQEQLKLRQDAIAAFHTAIEAETSDEEDENDLLVLREKTKDEIEEEEEEYRAYLQREVGEDLSGLITIEEGVREGGDVEDGVEADDGEEKKNKKEKKRKTKSTNSKQDEDQEFLVNYILNRGWIDRSARRLPTYSEITGKAKGKGKVKGEEDASEGEGDDSSEDEESNAQQSLDEDEFDDVADRFESSYNFRFEEPGAAEITRHPRNLPSLVRREDTTRKEAREKRKARKEEELLKKKEEVKRLKALKMKELRAKLERIGAEGGKKLNENTALQALDLEGDWDPDAHDRQMADLYAGDGAGYMYGEDDVVDEEKPTWDDDIDITDIVSNVESDGEELSKKKKKKKKKKGNEDEINEGGVDVNEMDADVEWKGGDDEEWDGTEEMRKRKVEEYMDEVYGLDFNDMVGGMPTRFRYTKVETQTFGLSPAEILTATDAELNTYMGIKKYAPYRKEGKGRNWDAQRGARLKDFKEKLQQRGAAGSGGGRETEGVGEKAKKRKGKKERMKEKAAAAAATGGTGEVGDGDEGEAEMEMGERPKEKKRKRDAEREQDSDDEGESDQDEDKGGTKKKRRRHRKHAIVTAAA